MSIEQQLVARLLAEPSLAALVGDRIEPVINSQDTPLPALSFQIIGRVTEHSHDGPGVARPRVQLTAIAGSYAEAVAVMAACKTALDGVRWDDGSASFVDNEFDGWDNSRSAGVFVRRMDVVVIDP